MKFLFCSHSNYGSIYPAIGVAKRLHNRGHKILFLTSSKLGKMIKKSGFELVPCAEKDNLGFRIYSWFKPSTVAIQVKYLEDAIKQFAPDVIVGQNLTLGPLITRRLYDIPVAILGLAAYLYPASESLLKRSPQTESEEQLVWRYGEMMKTYNEACQLLKLSPSSANYRETPLLGDLFLLRTVPELEGNINTLPKQVHFVGDCLWEPSVFDTQLSAWLQQLEDAKKPLIYVQPGRSFEDPKFWPYLVDALKNRPVSVVASVGRMDGEIGEIPDNFFIRKHIPQGLILPKAKAVISSGHSTAVLGAITHGLPSLIIPCGSGTEDIAERCQNAGVSISLSPFEMTAETIGKAIDQLLDSSNFQTHCKVLQQAFIKMNQKNKAVHLLEQLALTNYPLLRA
ncbi:MAG: hypothetical protein QNJ33_06885 [Crocosphaera sp.]|nr:hypothetical protein [Crocosphaera sp.]